MSNFGISLFQNPFAAWAFDPRMAAMQGYAQGLQAGYAASAGWPGAAGNQGLDLAIARFLMGMQTPAPNFPINPALAFALQNAMQQAHMGNGIAPGGCMQHDPQMMQQQQQMMQLLTMAILVGLIMNGGLGRQLNPPLSNGRSWGGGNRVPGWDPRTGAIDTMPNIPMGPVPGGSNMGNQLARSAAGVASRMGSVGYCYRGAKAAIRQATGVQLHGGSAYQAADQLAGSGRFREVRVSPDQLRQLPPGAVVVWGRTSRSPHGHISVALGDGREASDHIQRQMTSLRGATNFRVFIPNDTAYA